MIYRILIVSILMAMGTLILFNNYLPFGLEKAWTISLTTLVVFQIYNIFNVRSHIKSVFTQSVLDNKYLLPIAFGSLALHAFSIYTPFMQKILKTTAIDFNDWLIVLGLGLSIIVVEEIRKYLYRLSFKINKPITLDSR